MKKHRVKYNEINVIAPQVLYVRVYISNFIEINTNCMHNIMGREISER